VDTFPNCEYNPRMDLRPARYAFGVFAVALQLSACTAAQRQEQPSVPYAGSARWDEAAKTRDLLYVSDVGANSVDVFTYPQATLVGKLTGFGSVAGLCADKAGDVFVVDEAGPVQMFPHGGSTPIRKLATSGAPYGCSVDPVSGNLALTQLSSYQYGPISIYAGAKGKAAYYPDKQVDASWFCGYDDRGNLFADAWDRYGNVILLELPKGKKSFTTFKLGEKFANPGGVQWDGKDIAVSDRGGGVVYRLTESGHLAATITLKSGTNVEQFWILGSTLVGPNAQSPGAVDFWRYPGGGSPTKELTGFYYPFGATVSAGSSMK
jgi:hypothetical protein